LGKGFACLALALEVKHGLAMSKQVARIVRGKVNLKRFDIIAASKSLHKNLDFLASFNPPKRRKYLFLD
jgi:hypothetical protein